jgi:hypothetical protein
MLFSKSSSANQQFQLVSKSYSIVLGINNNFALAYFSDRDFNFLVLLMGIGSPKCKGKIFEITLFVVFTIIGRLVGFCVNFYLFLRWFLSCAMELWIFL